MDKFEQKKLLYNKIKSLVNNKKVCLLDLPNYINPGDQLIWEGEELLLKDLNINVKYRSSSYFFNSKKINKNDCIILHGGGNFGDIYLKHQNFRNYIINKYKNNRIIIMPSTIYFSSINNLIDCAKAYNNHNNLHIIARDNYSFKLLEQYFKNFHYLLPDSAMYINKIAYKEYKKNSVIFINRKDVESKNYNIYAFKYVKNVTVSDWPVNENNIFQKYTEIAFILLNISILFIHKILGSHWNEKFDVYGIFKYSSKEKQIYNTIKFISNYNLVITTRLHGQILSCILDIPNIGLDNSYGKNGNYYNTWINNSFKDAYFAKTLEDVKKIVEDNFSNHL